MTSQNHDNTRWPELVTPPWLQRPATLVALLIALGALAMALLPWVQTAQGEGRVVAESPLDRSQRIEAPIDGRLLRWHVTEGSYVQAGDLIAELSDNDPQILARLSGERDAVRARLDAARARSVAVRNRIVALEESRDAAVDAATKRVAMARDRVTAARKGIEVSKATQRVADVNARRQDQLGSKGIASERSRELAELESIKSQVELERTEALTSLARGDVRALQADVDKVKADTAAALQDANAAAALADLEIANAQAELYRLETRLARQEAMVVKAPMAGTVLRLLAAQGGEMVKQGDALAVLVPGAVKRAVELWIDGHDVPLVDVGTEVRLQFEGWPAVQFSGWPGLAVGTFVGKVVLVDAMDDGHGRFRVVVVPAPATVWPDARKLRQGVRAHAWFTLGEVRLGYELWRQFNGFPPGLAPTQEGSGAAPGTAHSSAGGGGKGAAKAGATSGGK